VPSPGSYLKYVISSIVWGKVDIYTAATYKRTQPTLLGRFAIAGGVNAVYI